MTAVGAASTIFWLFPTLCVLLVGLAAAAEWRHTEQPRDGFADLLRGLGEFSVAVAHAPRHRQPPTSTTIEVAPSIPTADEA